MGADTLLAVQAMLRSGQEMARDLWRQACMFFLCLRQALGVGGSGSPHVPRNGWISFGRPRREVNDGSVLVHLSVPGASSTLYLAAAGARSLLSAQTSAYGGLAKRERSRGEPWHITSEGLDGPLGGSFAVFCEATGNPGLGPAGSCTRSSFAEVTSGVWLAALCSKVGRGPETGNLYALLLWVCNPVIEASRIL